MKSSNRFPTNYIILTLLVVSFLIVSYTSLNIIKLDERKNRNGVVSSEHPLCSAIGVDILKQGGSVVDSAIASALCIGTINFQSSGIGGGGFLLYHSNLESVIFNFREKAPKAAFVEMFNTDPLSAKIGGLSVGVPGELYGFHEAHSRFGKLPWRDLFQPSIKLARYGWLISEIFADKIKDQSWILKDPIMARVLAPNGILAIAGDLISRPIYANTLSDIADRGIDIFYNGWIAQELVQTVKQRGGIMTLEDMINYNVEVTVPIEGTYRGLIIITAPPPASGAVLLTILNILENFEEFDELNPLNYHRVIEAFKHGYSQRGYYGDPMDPIYNNISMIAKFLTSKDTAYELYKKIVSNQTFEPEYYSPEFAIPENGGTMHLSISTNQESVSLTSTVNLLFGSRIMDNATGIILNDQMDDFSIPGTPNTFGLSPSPYNYIHPYKRPLSSSCPTIIVGEGLLGVVGASGGSHIITATALTLIRMFDFKEDVNTAVSMPRAHHQLIPNEVVAEFETSAKLVDGLRERGHIVKVQALGNTVTGVSAVKVDKGVISGAGDSRKGGVALGY